MRSQMAESFQEQYRIEEGEMPNIMFVQLESFFDPTEVEWLQFSEDPIPNLRKMFQNYSSGYFKAPSVGAGTANTEFEVLTGMSMRFFGPGEYPYKTYAKTKYVESAASALSALGYVQRHCTITVEISTAVHRYITIWDLTIIPAKSL